ncbi:MAG: serine protease [Vallitalea sp.]|jgi:membrane-bound ClpP family serine protease|nr:serine protease [Vallitalea sp.]
MDIINIISLSLIILGIILLGLEIIIPNFGIIGCIGIVSILAGVIITSKSFMEGVILFLFILVIAILLLIIIYKIMLKKGNPIILEESLKMDEQENDLLFFLDKEGVALTPLRPSGNADFDGVRLDVITNGDFISKGSKVIVSNVKGNKIIVKKLA